ncbi:hypothetical protein ACFOHS_16780 [Jhaorihella thermophila]
MVTRGGQRAVERLPQGLLLDQLVDDGLIQQLGGHLLILGGQLRAGDDHMAQLDLGAVDPRHHRIGGRGLGGCRQGKSGGKRQSRQESEAFAHEFFLFGGRVRARR